MPPMEIPPTMRAWVRRRRGSAQTALELVSDIPTPAPPPSSSSDVLIRVSHVSLQVTSELAMKILPIWPLTRTWIPELDLSGEIVAAGDNAPAELRQPGTRVTAFQDPPNLIIWGNGILAEYVRLPGSNVVSIDGEAASLDMPQASGIPCSGSTALRMVQTAGVRSGHTVLVNGASGSIGSVLVQMCKLRGATVVGVASGGNETMVRGLGVDEFVDYRKNDLPVYLTQHYGDKPFDFILDCAGVQPLYAHSPTYLKPEGAVINVGALDGIGSAFYNAVFNLFQPTWLGGVPRRYIMFSTPPTKDATVYVARLVEEGKVKVPVDSVFAMEDAVAAYERIGTKRARGKVVIKVERD